MYILTRLNNNDAKKRKKKKQKWYKNEISSQIHIEQTNYIKSTMKNTGRGNYI